MSSSVQEMPEDLTPIHGAWQGGPCPNCGDDMPANLVHCFTCRAMLNSALSDDTVEIPKFVPLPEIDPSDAGGNSDAPPAPTPASVSARGHYVRCGGCHEELRINAKYFGASVQCRHCEHTFTYDGNAQRIAMFSDCPHCDKEIRAGMKYVGHVVACRFCDGQLNLDG